MCHVRRVHACRMSHGILLPHSALCDRYSNSFGWGFLGAKLFACSPLKLVAVSTGGMVVVAVQAPFSHLCFGNEPCPISLVHNSSGL